MNKNNRKLKRKGVGASRGWNFFPPGGRLEFDSDLDFNADCFLAEPPWESDRRALSSH